MTEPDNVRRALFFHCGVGQLVEEGRFVSEKVADEWHGECPGRVVDLDGVKHKCLCECGCAKRKIVDLRKVTGTGARAHAEMAISGDHNVDFKQAFDSSDKAHTKRVSRKRVSTCQHCGEPTRGGMFLPGHDAKLKSDLQAKVKDESKENQPGRLRAVAELAMRGWPLPEGKVRESKAVDLGLKLAGRDDITLERLTKERLEP